MEQQTNLKTSQEVLNSFMQGNINTVSSMGTLLKERSEELQNVTDKLQRHIGNVCIQHDYRYYRCECLVTSLYRFSTLQVCPAGDRKAKTARSDHQRIG